MPKIFVTRKIPDVGLTLLRAEKDFDVVVSSHDRVLSHDELVACVKDADAVLSLLTDKIDGTVLDAAGKQLKIVANYAVGFDNVDLTAAKERSVVVTNTPGDLVTESVAEHAFALIIAVAHRIVESDTFAKAGEYKGWAPNLLTWTLLQGKTLGIVGLGRIGAAVARRAVKGMGMKVVYYDPKPNPDFEKEYSAEYKTTLDGLLAVADVVSLHVPLLPATRHLMSTDQFNLMKRRAILVNTARGPVVDEKALVIALEQERIAGAGIDVFECEPSIDCDPTDHHELKQMTNVVLTPHTASASREARDEMATIAAKNIIEVLRGRSALNPAK
ncbi:D-glycerate dehydrogenase [Candidatus Uhrbacteria bacterium]|nr:D-glycerate dehydrogenase [Candidatus Uhrbacteria bacterium]